MGKPNKSAAVPGHDKMGFGMSQGAGTDTKGSSSGKQLSQSVESLTGPKPKG